MYWIRTYKLRVNIPHFEKGVLRKPPRRVPHNVTFQKTNNHIARRNCAKVVVGGQSSGPQRRIGQSFMVKSQQKVPARSNMWNGFQFNINEEDISWLKEYFVGTTVDPEGIHCIRIRFDLEGILSATLIPMGCKMVLIKVLDGKSFEDTLKKKRDAFLRNGLQILDLGT